MTGAASPASGREAPINQRVVIQADAGIQCLRKTWVPAPTGATSYSEVRWKLRGARNTGCEGAVQFSTHSGWMI